MVSRLRWAADHLLLVAVGTAAALAALGLAGFAAAAGAAALPRRDTG